MKLTFEACIEMIVTGHRQAQEEVGRPISVAVVDDHGDLIAFGRMEGAPIRTIAIAVNKAFTAIYMSRNTHEFKQMLSREGMQANWYGDDRVTGVPGGLLIKNGDQIFGAVGVSGLSPQEDVQIAELILSRQ